MLTEIAWSVHRHPRVLGESRIAYRRADPSPTEYLTVKAEDGAWRWEVRTIRQHDALGRPLRLAGGSRDTLKDAKAAALTAYAKL